MPSRQPRPPLIWTASELPALSLLGSSRLRLALPRYRDKIPSAHRLAFQSLCRVYEVDELRKEVPCREELLAEYEGLCRSIEADAVAMLEGKTSDRWF